MWPTWKDHFENPKYVIYRVAFCIDSFGPKCVPYSNMLTVFSFRCLLLI